MENAVDLSLQSIQGVGWRPGRKDEYTTALSGIKAYVSFTGNVPDMKISSFAICFETGNLLIESNTPTVIGGDVEGTEEHGNERKFLDVTFADQPSKGSSSCDSSSYQPHVQLPLGDGISGVSPDEEKSERYLNFHIVFRSIDDGIIAEGAASLEIPKTNFDGLPLILDLPIKEVAKVNAVRTPAKPVYFDESACIRVHLQHAAKQENIMSLQDIPVTESLLSNKVEKIHQLEGTGIQDFQNLQKKDHLFEPMHKGLDRNNRFWVFQCGGGTVDLKHSVKHFWREFKQFRTKCTDEEIPELLTSPTMQSTILTRDSLEI